MLVYKRIPLTKNHTPRLPPQVWPRARLLLCKYHKRDGARKEIHSTRRDIPQAERDRVNNDVGAIIDYEPNNNIPTRCVLLDQLRRRLQVRTLCV